MPTYEYECKSCSHTFEAFQSMSDDPLTECPKCGGEVRRLIGGGMGIIFKGSGFYVTDNRAGSSKKSGSSGSESKSSSGSKDSSSKSDGSGSSSSSADTKKKQEVKK